MYSYNLSRLFTTIVNGYRCEQKIIHIKKSKFIYNILVFLYKEGYIFGFYNKNLREKKFYIELKYKLNGYKFLNTFNKFIVLHRKTFISTKQLKRHYCQSFSIVLATTRGIILGNIALAYNIGGFILFRIF
jgi:ribosomal protein S8